MSKNYNEFFRVFDNGGETVDRYTVFLRNNPEEGALGLSENPSHPQGFSQWGDFDVEVVERNNTEISFNDLPRNVQAHVLDRFEVTESTDVVSDMWGLVIESIINEDKEKASACVRELVIEKIGNMMAQPLNELDAGRIKIVGDKVVVKGKVVGQIDTDPAAKFGTGILVKLRDGTKQEFDTITDLIRYLKKEFRLKESLDAGRIKIVSDDVFVKGKRVGKIENDLNDMERGIVLHTLDGKEIDFDDINQLFKYLQTEFKVSESVQIISEASDEQKAVVRALRKLAKKLEIPNPRFRSLNGKAGFVEMSPKNWREDSIPNDLRKKAVVKVFNAVPQNFSNVDYGNVRRESIALTTQQWIQLLGYYGIEVESPIAEDYKILPSIDRDRYPDREHQGLEGPFRARNGKVVYYDPKEGKYYDPDSDLYISFEEWEAMDKDRG